MGIFRKLKADRYTAAQAAAGEKKAREVVYAVAGSCAVDSPQFVQALHRWAEFRELLARKVGDGDSDVR